MVEAGARVALAVFDEQDGPAEKIARQRHHSPAGKSLARHRVAGKVDISEIVDAAVAHLRPLAGQKEQREKGDECSGATSTGASAAAAQGASVRMASAAPNAAMESAMQ